MGPFEAVGGLRNTYVVVAMEETGGVSFRYVPCVLDEPPEVCASPALGCFLLLSPKKVKEFPAHGLTVSGRRFGPEDVSNAQDYTETGADALGRQAARGRGRDDPLNLAEVLPRPPFFCRASCTAARTVSSPS